MKRDARRGTLLLQRTRPQPQGPVERLCDAAIRLSVTGERFENRTLEHTSIDTTAQSGKDRT